MIPLHHNSVSKKILGRGTFHLRFALQEQIRDRFDAEEQRKAASEHWPSKSEGEALFRLRVAEILRAHQLFSKAARFESCSQFGYVVECKGEDAHHFYTVEYCDLRFCARCGPRMFKRLYARYACILDYVQRHPRPNYRLRQITLTSKNTGSLNSDQIKEFNGQVKETIKRLMKGVKDWGALWVNEVGFNNTNLHAHILIFCPYVPQKRLAELWNKVSGNSVVWINQTHVPGSLALLYLLKYVSKPPSEDPHSIAALEVAFHGTRRVHSLGLFFNFSREDPDGKNSIWKTCPKCGADLKRGKKVYSLNELLSMKLEFIGDCRKKEGKRTWAN